MRRWSLATSGVAFALSLLACGVARAEDGGNDACPPQSADADDVRERYDAKGRLLHQLRLKQGQDVEEVHLVYGGDHVISRTEATPGHLRVTRNTFKDDKLVHGECTLDGVPLGSVTLRYDDDDHPTLIEKRQFVNGAWAAQSTRFYYNADGQLIASEVRDGDGKLVNISHLERSPLAVPIVIALSAGGSYQSDTELYDFTAGLGIHRRPPVQRYGSDPLEVGLDGVFKYHRAAHVTSTDQVTVRFAADYHDILPRLTLFTFTSTDRNLPANLRLNLEEAVIGVKFDVLRHKHFSFDVSFAPVWNFRSITSPPQTDMSTTSVQENTSKLRGSLRVRGGIRYDTWSLIDTFEFLPTIFGDEVAQEHSFWNRTVLRNTLTFDVLLTKHLTFHEEFKYTRDIAMRAQASCPDDSNPLCSGYAFTSTTSVVLNLQL